MVQGLEGHLVTPSWRLCEILGASPQLVHIGLVPGVFICKPLAYLDCMPRPSSVGRHIFVIACRCNKSAHQHTNRKGIISTALTRLVALHAFRLISPEVCTDPRIEIRDAQVDSGETFRHPLVPPPLPDTEASIARPVGKRNIQRQG
jgi:hypothetical protein